MIGFNLFGVPVVFDWTTIVLFLLFGFDAFMYLKRYEPRASGKSRNVAVLAASVTVVFSIVLHELAHALVAFALGNPITGAKLGFPASFVSTTFAPWNMTPLNEILVALAGPLTNLIIGGAAAYFVWKWPESLKENTFQYVSVLNLKLARINLLWPILLLDGGKVADGIIRLIQPIIGFNDAFRLGAWDYISWIVLVWWIARDQITGKKHPGFEEKVAIL